MKWQQTILTPPIRQRVAPACNAASDGQCPPHYSLSGNLDAAVPITGAGLPGESLHIGHLYIDNPNPVPVRVNVIADGSVLWQRGRIGAINPFYTGSVPFTAGCMPAQLPMGAAMHSRPREWRWTMGAVVPSQLSPTSRSVARSSARARDVRSRSANFRPLARRRRGSRRVRIPSCGVPFRLAS